jgi:hypothetical protein
MILSENRYALFGIMLARIMTGELAPARHVFSAATAAENQDQIGHMVRCW